MSQSPALADLSAELTAVRDRWMALAKQRAEQDALYASEFAEPFGRLFAALPLHGAPSGMGKPRGLVSMLGLSWQPVALMAAWARPERMLVIGTRDSLALRPGGEPVLALIARVAGLERDAILPREVGDPGETEIYEAVRDFVRDTGIPPRQIYVDPTGGKKSMSASTALAGFLTGAPLVYVDYGTYDPTNRIPVAGTEYPRLLANPLEVLGDLELRDVYRAFDRGDFQEAEHLATRLAQRLYEPRQAETLALLARGYGAWDRFAFSEACDGLTAGADHIDRFAAQGRWTWAPGARAALSSNLSALRQLAEVTDKPSSVTAGAPLLAWYAAAARRLHRSKPSLAVLLTYAAVERYIDLVLWVEHGLDDEEPDYARIAGRVDAARFEQAGKALFGKKYQRREMSGPLMLGNGAQLLATLDPARLAVADLGPLQGLSSARNKCEYEHGLVPKTPTPDQASRFLDQASAILARAFDSRSAFDEAVAACAFPVLGETG